MTGEGQQSLLEKAIDELYSQAWEGEKRGKRVAAARRVIAYLLKAIAGGGSLVVATGHFPQWHQWIGVAILVAILLDSLSSNHKRLLTEVQAGYAYEFLHVKVKRKFTPQLDPLLKQLKKPNLTRDAAEATQNEIDALQQKTYAELSEGLEQIRKTLAAADLKALEALALDNERAAVQQTNK